MGRNLAAATTDGFTPITPLHSCSPCFTLSSLPSVFEGIIKRVESISVGSCSGVTGQLQPRSTTRYLGRGLGLLIKAEIDGIKTLTGRRWRRDSLGSSHFFLFPLVPSFLRVLVHTQAPSLALHPSILPLSSHSSRSISTHPLHDRRETLVCLELELLLPLLQFPHPRTYRQNARPSDNGAPLGPRL